MARARGGGGVTRMHERCSSGTKATPLRVPCVCAEIAHGMLWFYLFFSRLPATRACRNRQIGHSCYSTATPTLAPCFSLAFVLLSVMQRNIRRQITQEIIKKKRRERHAFCKVVCSCSVTRLPRTFLLNFSSFAIGSNNTCLFLSTWITLFDFSKREIK